MTHTALDIIGLLVFSLASVSADETSLDWKLTDIDGKHHEPFAETSTCCLVVIFISTDCPIANSYQPLIQRLANQYQKEGVRTIMVHPSPTLSIEDARKHANAFNITTPVVIDTDQSIARRAGATVTPQAFVFVQNQKRPVYQGRIDNLYAGYGKKRKVATTHDLGDAIKAVVDGRTVSNAKTKAVGCFISYVE
jgi:hypothetical protein